MKKNVILITIDCLRADHLSCYGYKRKTTPFIDFLVSKGERFENAFANGPFTTASFLSILASAYPLDFEQQLPLSKDATLISEILQTKGIKTAAIHSNPYLSAFYGYNRGWDLFEDFLFTSLKVDSIKKQKNKISRVIPARLKILYHLLKLFLIGIKAFENAETITNYAINWIEKNKDSSFFLWVHYMDLHEPYFISNTKKNRRYSKNVSRISQVKFYVNSQKGKVTQEAIRSIIDIYDDKLRYIDEQLKILVNFLENKGLLDNTLLIITSDHGQEFLDHGRFGHFARFYDEVIHIPLILFGSGIEGYVNKNLVSQIDIPPTILHFYNFATPEEYRGNSLLVNNELEHILSEAIHNENGVYIMNNIIYQSEFQTQAIRTKKWKYIYRYDKEDYRKCELYHLLNDPEEKIDVSKTHEEITNEFLKILKQHQSERKHVNLKRKTKKSIKKLKI